MREQELRASLAALRVAEAHIWDYPDFLPDSNRGMEHRDGLRALAENDIVPRMADVIQALKPKALLTFAPNGSNGHPDHVYTHLFTLKALELSGHSPERLYYFAAEKPYAGEARPGFMAPEEIAAKHLYPTHFVHLGTEIEAKLKAMGQHRTQALSVLSFMHYAPRRLHVESFHQAYPARAKDEGAETVLWL